MARDRILPKWLVTIAAVVGLVLLGLLLLLMTGWGIMALLHFGKLGAGLKKGLALAYGVASLVMLVGYAWPRFRWRALGCHLGLFAVLLGCWIFLLKPSNDREWHPEYKVQAYATVEGDKVTVHNIRNFQWRTVGEFTPAYYDKTYDLKDLDEVDLVTSHWMGPDIAHVMLSFGFKGQDYLCFSIEMRREANEGGSTIRSFFRQYELFYVVADERDLIRVRTNVRKSPPEDVYVWKLKGDAQTAGRRMFMAYIDQINHLKAQPEWYNTLTSNCTNTIWFHSLANPGHMPYSWRILVSGHLAGYMFEQGKIQGEGPFAEVQKRSHVNARAQAADQAEDFSRRIRADQPR